MKRILIFLFPLFMIWIFVSGCGGGASESISLNDSTIKGSDQLIELGNEVATAYKTEKRKLMESIGSPLKINNLLVAQNDFLFDMTWDEAQKACEIIGDGWRLPTINELKSLDEYHYKVGGRFGRGFYWSSEESREKRYGIKMQSYQFAQPGNDWDISVQYGNIPEGAINVLSSKTEERPTFVVKNFSNQKD